MSTPPSKGETSPPANTRPPVAGGKIYSTRATTAATSANKAHTAKTMKENPAVKESQAKAAEKTAAEEQHPASDDSHAPSLLQKIVTAIGQITSKRNIDSATKQSLEDIITLIHGEKEKEVLRIEASAKEEATRKTIKADLVNMYTALSKQLNGIQDTANATLTSSSKLLADTENVAAATKDLTGKTSKITDTADRIATDTSKYRDAVLTRPTQTQTLRNNTNPKILGDIERKGRQILVEHLSLEGTNVLEKSLTELTAKANEAISTIKDAEKPKDIKVQTLFKTRREALVLTLNSKEAVTWITQADIEMAFTAAFAEGSHIAERTYSIIVPNVPISFDPKDDKHLREVEEANGLKTKEIVKAKWIKPIGRRRPDQTRAYIILALSSADSANLFIRDRMNICNARVRPKKQKAEPVQCIKCRRWGHFTSDCQADKDTCGTCGGSHRTNACTNKGHVYCVSCGDKTHASWDRTCPEFSRRCAIQDERNPENAMPFYPTEHDWTLTARPHRIPLDERFPGRYAVNSLPTTGHKWSGKETRPTRKANGGNSTQRTKENPNHIPLNRNKEAGEPFGVDDRQDTELSGPTFDWTNKDEEDYHHAKNQVC